ncbi:unnamed protein product [Caenorhabditis auriculariae]|uniref:Uncharacterized protein n=1 Tax=Caenorhabditis auriculariae TaxID=2777116 RepID=A0A8S1HAU5_9PELO|nr:unnamed protein product [Caenorhabditis auriculariae]
MDSDSLQTVDNMEELGLYSTYSEPASETNVTFSDLLSRYTLSPSEANVTMADIFNQLSSREACNEHYGLEDLEPTTAIGTPQPLSSYSPLPSETAISFEDLRAEASPPLSTAEFGCYSIYSNPSTETVFCEIDNDHQQTQQRDESSLNGEIEEEQTFEMTVCKEVVNVVDSNECLRRLPDFQPIPIIFNKHHYLVPAEKRKLPSSSDVSSTATALDAFWRLTQSTKTHRPVTGCRSFSFIQVVFSNKFLGICMFFVGDEFCEFS